MWTASHRVTIFGHCHREKARRFIVANRILPKIFIFTQERGPRILSWLSVLCLLSAVAERFDFIPAKADFLSWVSILASLLVFTAALFLPALHLEREEPVNGIWLLVWGWCGVFFFNFAWFANPFYLAALICAAVGRWRTAQIFVGFAIGLGALSIFTRQWHTNTPVRVLRMGSAFYVWVAGFGVLLVGMTLARLITSSPAE